jgi:hypothetical protein
LTIVPLQAQRHEQNVKRILNNNFDVITGTSNGREQEKLFPCRPRTPQQSNTVIGSVREMRRATLASIFIDRSGTFAAFRIVAVKRTNGLNALLCRGLIVPS